MNRFSSIFSQLLQLFPRNEFQRAVNDHQAERHARGFTSWNQFVAMLFCQVARANSLREIRNGLKSCEGKLVHLNCTAPSHATLAYANQHRPWELYRTLFFQLFDRCRGTLDNHPQGRKKFRFKNKLVSLDSSVIDLCLSLFDWAHFRQAKGAVKLHLLLDHDGYLPKYAVISDGKTADITVARQFWFEPGTILVIDRGYNDYRWFASLTERKVLFITKQKDKAKYRVIEQRPVPQNRNIQKDEIIILTGVGAYEKCPYSLRRIEAVDPSTGEITVFLTNHFTLGASTVVAVYKDRWGIETFFRYLKQNLKIKTFVGTSSNAVHTQIWTALIALLILRFLQVSSRFTWSLSNLVAVLRLNLFTYRDLWAWLDKPFDTPPLSQLGQQLQYI